MEYYNTQELLNKYGEKGTIDFLINKVINGEIRFPFHKYFLGSPEKLFHNLKEINLPVYKQFYRLYSYHGKHGLYMPPKFRGTPFIIGSSTNTYETADVLSDHFIEEIRLLAKRSDQKYSIMESWNNIPQLKQIMETAISKDTISDRTLRDAIYETFAETKTFNPSWAIALLKNVLNKDLTDLKWLDISAGWGDRLIAAMSLNMQYLGYDPNVQLQEGHNKMIELFGDVNKHKIKYEPFEIAILPDDKFDVVLSSPPFFDIEQYSSNQKGQSIVSYPVFNTWVVHFLFRSLIKAWNALKEDGFLILHLGDSKTVHLCEVTNLFIETNLDNSSFEGVIGLQGEAGFPRPVWVWKKSIDRKIWKAEKERSLYAMYPEIHRELFIFYLQQKIPDIAFRNKDVATVRLNLKSLFPTVRINEVVNDVVITSLLNKMSVIEVTDYLNKTLAKLL